MTGTMHVMTWRHILTPIRRQYKRLPCAAALADAPLISRVKTLLEKASSTFNYRCQRRFHHPPAVEPLRVNVPWADIIIACVEFGISLLEGNKMLMHAPQLEGIDSPLSTVRELTVIITSSFKL
ncbi:hypothetical protein EB796_005850 [Bugula neritina]|uniref:Uncharacterized protein n=1 Tax=Bugula neritina TaxID=10212 RepID=A0A7J7KDZ1_BUGNE|nr:hypothetical protein EB796_005850 [Bugula neritina]